MSSGADVAVKSHQEDIKECTPCVQCTLSCITGGTDYKTMSEEFTCQDDVDFLSALHDVNPKHLLEREVSVLP